MTAEDSCLKAGFPGTSNPCVGSGTTASVDVGVLTEQRWGMRGVDGLERPHVVESRGTLVWWGAVEAGGIIAGSVYGQDGVVVQGIWHILGPIGEVLTTYKRPILLGGDWNTEPEKLCSSG